MPTVDEFIAAAKAPPKPMLGTTFRPQPRPTAGRLIFGLDATASRQPTWDLSAGLTYQMFRETDAVGGLEMRLCYFRGANEFGTFDWVSDSGRLIKFMESIRCLSGQTQIGKVLAHAKAENAKRKVGALVFIGDALERVYDSPEALRAAASSLGPPAFMFQEGDDPEVKAAFQDIASLSRGAYARFEPGAATQLAAMLKAVAVFCAGGIAALKGRRDEESQLLLAQMKGT